MSRGASVRAVPARRLAAVAPTVALGVALAVALAGCGGSSPSSSIGEASKPASQILADAQAALGRVHSFSFEGHGSESGRPVAISVDVQLPGRLHATLSQGKGSVQFIVIGSALYLNANAAYWAAQGTPAAAVERLANRWLILPSASAPGLGSLLASADPATVGRCTLGPHLGTITVRGRAVVNGQPVIVLADSGNVPGGTPGLYYLAASGPPLPLRAVQTGPQTPGGKPDAACHETRDDVTNTTVGEVINIGQFNRAPAITAPPGAVTLPALAGGTSV